MLSYRVLMASGAWVLAGDLRLRSQDASYCPRGIEVLSEKTQQGGPPRMFKLNQSKFPA